MLNIIIYTLCGLGIGFSLGMLAVAVYVDRRAKKRKRELLARYIGARGSGKTGCSTINPYCYIDLKEEEDKQ